MHCHKVLELLPRFIEDDFSDEESREIAAHLESCESCSLEHRAMRDLVERLEAIPSVPVPAAFKESVMRLLPPRAGAAGEPPKPPSGGEPEEP